MLTSITFCNHGDADNASVTYVIRHRARTPSSVKLEEVKEQTTIVGQIIQILQFQAQNRKSKSHMCGQHMLLRKEQTTLVYHVFPYSWPHGFTRLHQTLKTCTPFQKNFMLIMGRWSTLYRCLIWRLRVDGVMTTHINQSKNHSHSRIEKILHNNISYI